MKHARIISIRLLGSLGKSCSTRGSTAECLEALGSDVKGNGQPKGSKSPGSLMIGAYENHWFPLKAGYETRLFLLGSTWPGGVS